VAAVLCIPAESVSEETSLGEVSPVFSDHPELGSSADHPEAACPTLAQAYAKYQVSIGRMRKMFHTAQTRANVAEKASNMNKAAADRCINAEKMLASPTRIARMKVRQHIMKAARKQTVAHMKEKAALIKQWKQKVEAARKKEAIIQQKKLGDKLKKAAAALVKLRKQFAEKQKLFKKDMMQLKLKQKAKIQSMNIDLQAAKKKAIPALQAAHQARAESKVDLDQAKKNMRAMTIALKVTKAQLHAKTRESLSCSQALKGKGGSPQPALKTNAKKKKQGSKPKAPKPAL